MSQQSPVQHLVKWCVGIETVDHLAAVQKARLAKAGPGDTLRHVTRQMPRRSEALLAGGSLYWVIKGVLQVRQTILGLEATVREDGKPACAVIIDPRLVRTQARSWRAFQGWRYLPAVDAPPDLAAGSGAEAEALPADLARELRMLGLL